MNVNSLVESIDCPILLLELRNSLPFIRGVNKKFRLDFGYKASELNTRPLSEIISDNHGNNFSSELNFNQQEIDELPVSVSSKTNQKIPAKLTIKPIEQGSYAIATITPLSDIAGISNQQDSLNLANLCHDIKTPLNSIIGFTELLKSRITDDSQDRIINSILTSSNMLLAFVNNAMEWGRMEAGKFNLKPEQVSMFDIAMEMVDIFWDRCDRKNIQLKAQVSPSMPDVIADGSKIRQILINLLGNAIKFTKSGNVELIISMKKLSEYKCDLKIMVCDTGSGIKNDEQNTIFDTFKQSTGIEQKTNDGMGLGLAITKRLVTVMNGSITIKSKQDKGSCFVIKLPGIELADCKDKSEAKKVRSNATAYVNNEQLEVEIPQHLVSLVKARFCDKMDIFNDGVLISEVHKISDELMEIATLNDTQELNVLASRLTRAANDFDLQSIVDNMSILKEAISN